MVRFQWNIPKWTWLQLLLVRQAMWTRVEDISTWRQLLSSRGQVVSADSSSCSGPGRLSSFSFFFSILFTTCTLWATLARQGTVWTVQETATTVRPDRRGKSALVALIQHLTAAAASFRGTILAPRALPTRRTFFSCPLSFLLFFVFLSLTHWL